MPTATVTGPPTTTPVPTTPEPSPSQTSSPIATAAQVESVAASVYPQCTSSRPCPATGTHYTVCDSGSAGFAGCPLTARLAAQLQADVQGQQSGPDPLGGGQDPEWADRSITTTPGAASAVAHVTLGFAAGASSEKIDLVVVLSSGRLLVDDIYCTGHDPATQDAYAPGWTERSTCGS